MNPMNNKEFNQQLATLESGKSLPTFLDASDRADLELAMLLFHSRRPAPASLEQSLQKIAMRPAVRSGWERIAWVAAAFCLIFFLTLAVSPAARGALLAVIHKVGEGE